MTKLIVVIETIRDIFLWTYCYVRFYVDKDVLEENGNLLWKDLVMAESHYQF